MSHLLDTSWLLTKRGAISVATALTALVLAESIWLPLAPYFVLYAILAILIPLFLRTYQFAPIGATLKNHWKWIIGVFALDFMWGQVFNGLYERVLVNWKLDGNPFYSLNAAIDVLANAAAHKFAITPDVALTIYALFILLWAPVGEELFYRGYLQGVLRRSWGFKPAALVSAAFFGIRHATHLFFLWPDVPVAAACIWVVSAFGSGLLMSYLYEKTRSLLPPMLVHAALNVIEILASA
jgi:hypothetical protein